MVASTMEYLLFVPNFYMLRLTSTFISIFEILKSQQETINCIFAIIFSHFSFIK